MQYGKGITFLYDNDTYGISTSGEQVCFGGVEMFFGKTLKRANLKMVAFDRPAQGRIEIQMIKPSKNFMGTIEISIKVNGEEPYQECGIMDSELDALGIVFEKNSYFWLSLYQKKNDKWELLK